MDWMLLLCVFVIAIFAANIIQGITGFAGTLIAMPILIMILDLQTAKHVLNLTGLLASLYIVWQDWRYIDRAELPKILILMGSGMIIGIVSYQWMPVDVLLKIFALFILLISLRGLWQHFQQNNTHKKRLPPLYVRMKEQFILLWAGIFHGLFVAGGPLLVAYFSSKAKPKQVFRVSLSFVWLILNSFIFIQGILYQEITYNTMYYSAIACVPLFAGIYVGGQLLQRLNQRHFMLISYILLIISGISLFFK